MEKKIYIDAQEYLRDCWRLARAVYDSGWKPDVLMALWRGGAFPGVAVHEFLAVKGWRAWHVPVKCRSYTGIGAQDDTVEFDCAGEAFAALKAGARVLVVDDVFDSGRTAAAVAERLAAIPCEAKIACVYWKPENNRTDARPDFHVRTVGEWIVFPHEIEGLTPDETAEKDPVLADLLRAEI